MKHPENKKQQLQKGQKGEELIKGKKNNINFI